MNILEIIGVPYFKKGSGIHIKKKNRGKFTEYCGGKVTNECIQRAKRSNNPKLRKRATFAANARTWKHQNGGLISKHQKGTTEGGILKRVAKTRAFEALFERTGKPHMDRRYYLAHLIKKNQNISSGK